MSTPACSGKAIAGSPVYYLGTPGNAAFTLQLSIDPYATNCSSVFPIYLYAAAATAAPGGPSPAANNFFGVARIVNNTVTYTSNTFPTTTVFTQTQGNLVGPGPTNLWVSVANGNLSMGPGTTPCSGPWFTVADTALTGLQAVTFGSVPAGSSNVLFAWSAPTPCASPPPATGGTTLSNDIARAEHSPWAWIVGFVLLALVIALLFAAFRPKPKEYPPLPPGDPLAVLALSKPPPPIDLPPAVRA